VALIKAIIGGLVGAAIGAAVWAAIVHYGDYEIGIVAWGIGVLAGVGVRIGAGDRLSGLTGAIAVLIALLGVAGGKWGAASMYISQYDHTVLQSEEAALSALSYEVYYERLQAGDRVAYPAGIDPNFAFGREEVPQEIWQEAKDRFRDLPRSDQQALERCPALANPECVLAFIARAIAEDREVAGERINWPGYEEMDERTRREHYPSDIWEEAEAEWAAMSPSDQAAFASQVETYMIDLQKQYFEAATEVFTAFAFIDSFSLFDLLWVFLAVASAWKLGTGEAQSIGEA
jgi:hypothetical protein